MKYLGIDYGTKKVGLAFSDDAGVLAFPHKVIPNNDKFRDVLEDILKHMEISDVVMGHSINNDGEENPVMIEARGLADALTREGFTVHFEPEFFTTVQAKRNTADAHADASAAALILQGFLDKE